MKEKIRTELLPQKIVGVGEVRGFEFTQETKGDHAYIYGVKSKSVKPYFEVFKRKASRSVCSLDVRY